MAAKKSQKSKPSKSQTSTPKLFTKPTWKDIDNNGNISNHNQNAIYGYIRLNYMDKTKIFPVDIIKLIIFFYQDGINWKFTKQEISLFQTADSYKDRILSESFEINGIIFNYVTYPNYCDDSDYYHYTSWNEPPQKHKRYGDVHFGLEATKIPSNVEYMKIYFELHCVETNNTFKSTHSFGAHQASGSVQRFFKSKDIEQYFPNGVTFRGCMDILCIKYKEKDYKLNRDPRFMDLTKIDKFCKFNWKIDKEMILSKCRDNRYNKNVINSQNEWRIYSETNFNHNSFGLCLSNCRNVNGMNAVQSKSILVAVRMFRIPAKVKQLDVNIKCNIIGGIGDKMYKRSRIIKNGSEQSFNLCKFQSQQQLISELMHMLKDVLVKVEIEIVKVFDYDDNKIEENKWREYGVL